MNLLILIASILSMLAAIIHMIGGEKTVFDHLLKSDVKLNSKLELRGVWYAFGIDLAITSIFLFFLSFESSLVENQLFIIFCSLRFILYGLGVLFAVLITDRKHFFKVPQWLLLLVIGIITLLGLYTF